MKTLLILRHAKSSWSNSHLSDHDRPLNDRGQRDAPRMGNLLRDEDLLPDLIISSTAERALATAEAVADAAEYDGELWTTRDLYHADPEAFIEVLQEAANSADRVMVVGHNPGVEELVEMLTGEAERMPTAALAVVKLPIDDWRKLDYDVQGELAQIWRPRELS